METRFRAGDRAGNRVGRRSRTGSDGSGAHRIALERDRSIRLEEERLSRWGVAPGGGRTRWRVRRTGRSARRLGTGPDSVSTMVVGRIAEAGTISSSGAGAETGSSRSAGGASIRLVHRGCATGSRGSLTVGSTLRFRGVRRATSARGFAGAGRRCRQCGARCVVRSSRLPFARITRGTAGCTGDAYPQHRCRPATPVERGRLFGASIQRRHGACRP